MVKTIGVGILLALFSIIWLDDLKEWTPTITMYSKNLTDMYTNFTHGQPDRISSSKESSSIVPSTETGIYDVSMGASSDQVIKILGNPDRRDKNNLGYEWWIYNKDLTHYIQVGVKNGFVTDLYSNAPTWSFRGLHVGSSKNSLRSVVNYQDHIDLQNQNGKVTIQNTNEEYELYIVSDTPVVFYLDKYKNYQVTAIRWISKESLTVGAFFNRTSTFSLHPIPLEKHPLNAEDTLEVEMGTAMQILDITNVYRLREGLQPLSWNQAASRIAKAHSQDMVEHHFFDHRSPTTGLDPFQRMNRAGITFKTAGENIAAGQEDGASVVEGWMNSEGHRTNILNKEFTTLGVGVYHNNYTQDFVTP